MGYGLRGVNFGVNLVAKKYGYENVCTCMGYERYEVWIKRCSTVLLTTHPSRPPSFFLLLVVFLSTNSASPLPPSVVGFTRRYYRHEKHRPEVGGRLFFIFIFICNILIKLDLFFFKMNLRERKNGLTLAI